MGHYCKHFDTAVETIVTECEFMTLDQKHRVKVNNVMWDTGSSATILSHRLVTELHPTPFQKGGIVGIGGETDGNTYLLHVFLPTGDVVTCHEVYEANIDCDAIIGMDIITKGDFHLESRSGRTTFIFSI